jgi:hypothetical protein
MIPKLHLLEKKAIFVLQPQTLQERVAEMIDSFRPGERNLRMLGKVFKQPRGTAFGHTKPDEIRASYSSGDLWRVTAKSVLRNSSGFHYAPEVVSHSPSRPTCRYARRDGNTDVPPWMQAEFEIGASLWTH